MLRRREKKNISMMILQDETKFFMEFLFKMFLIPKFQDNFPTALSCIIGKKMKEGCGHGNEGEIVGSG